MATKKGRAVMSYFVNRQGLKIRTYASEVDKPKGKIFLVHGIKSHFRGDYCGYNVDWYLNQVGEYKTEQAFDLDKLELNLVFPAKKFNSYHTQCSNQLTSSGSEPLSYENLNGRDVFEVTPRFKYEGSFLEYLNNLGYSTYGLDHQSHGLSESVTDSRCYFDQFDDVCYDLLQFITLVKKGNFYDTDQRFNEQDFVKNTSDITTSTLYKGKSESDRYFLFGISMGGNVVLRTLELYHSRYSNGEFGKSDLIDGLVCFSGMIDIEHHYKTLKCIMPLLRFFNKFMPKFGIAKPTDFLETLTMFMRFHVFSRPYTHFQDPLYFRGKLYLKMALMIYDATKTLDKNFHFYPSNLPTLFLHSKNDMTTNVNGPRYLMKKYFANSSHAKLLELDGAAHVITSPLYTTITGPLVQEFLQSF